MADRREPSEVMAAFGRTRESIGFTLSKQEFVDALEQVSTSGLQNELADRRGMLRWGKNNPAHRDEKLEAGIREEMEAIQQELDTRGDWEKYVGRMVRLFARCEEMDTDPPERDIRAMNAWYACEREEREKQQ